MVTFQNNTNNTNNTKFNVKGWKSAFTYFNNWFPIFWDHISNSLIDDPYNKTFPTTSRKNLSKNEKGHTRNGNYNAQFGMNVAYKEPGMKCPGVEIYLCRVETRTRNEGKTLVIDEKKMCFLPTGEHKNIFMLLGNKGYYSVFDHSWLNNNKYYKREEENIPAHECIDKNGKVRHYRERIKNNRLYDLEALLRDGQIWQAVFNSDEFRCESISGNVLEGTEKRIIHESDLFSKLYSANDLMRGFALSESGLTIEYDPKPSTVIRFAANDETRTIHEITISEFCAKMTIRGSREFRTLSNKVHRRLDTFLERKELKPLVAPNGKTYYIANTIVDIEKTNEGVAKIKEERKQTAEEIHKMRAKIRNWLKRHDWQMNPKWDENEKREAFMMISNKRNNVKETK